MPRHERPRAGASVRASIASTAARLIAEDGITDYHLAKRKAVRQLGLPEHTSYPDNAEIDAELRAYRSLYQGDGHLEVLRWLHKHRAEGCTTDAIDWAAGNGHLDAVRWLYNNRGGEVCTWHKAIDEAATNGHPEVVAWLEEHF